MIQGIKRTHSSEFKGRVALEAAAGAESTAQLSSKHEVHPTQVGQWRKRLMEGAHELFEDRTPAEALKEKESLIEKLYAQIGQLTVERDWLKKKIGTL